MGIVACIGAQTSVADQTSGRKDGDDGPLAEFLRSLTRRGLRGVKLVISDNHLGLKAAIAKVLEAAWQRPRVRFVRDALAHAVKNQRRMVAAAFAQDSAEAAREP